MVDTSIVLYGETGGPWIRFYLCIEVLCHAVPELLCKLYFSLILASFVDRPLSLRTLISSTASLTQIP
jgi:hypothetical protein